MKPTACPPPLIGKQQGSVLLEALIAILIFSFGLLGLIGIQASAVGLSIDAKYRADAAYLANQIVSQMWVDRANMDTYAHHATGNACVSDRTVPPPIRKFITVQTREAGRIRWPTITSGRNRGQTADQGHHGWNNSHG